MGEPLTNEEILDLTKDLFCYGVEDVDLKLRMDFVRSLRFGAVILDFGTGYGRMAYVMAMANPEIKVVTFDHGRKEIDIKEYPGKIMERAGKLGITNVDFSLNEAADLDLIGGVSGLNMDIEGKYGLLKAVVENCFPFVNPGGSIFVQSYYREDTNHVGIKQAIDEYVKKHQEYILGNQHKNTLIIHKE
jgi:2-polyprenyl-3-methyl-5-hydroxy-6-metoxy-1,4-benzoquinol methylase